MLDAVAVADLVADVVSYAERVARADRVAGSVCTVAVACEDAKAEAVADAVEVPVAFLDLVGSDVVDIVRRIV